MTEIQRTNIEVCNEVIAWDLGKDVTYSILIANLGGYEKAKAKLHSMPLYSDKSLDKAMEIDHALLQYRREHGIFEVGDNVVSISGHSDEVHFLSDWYIENLDFRYTTKSGAWGVIVKSCMNGVWRHATDAEIKANKRLEVL